MTLTAFEQSDITPRYLSWLGDAEVNQYSQRHGQAAPTAEEARAWLAERAPDEHVLAIRTDDRGHVGNLKYGPVDRHNSRADISILIGEKQCWGTGIGAESIYLLTRHLFADQGLNRVDAGSGNPAFIRMVQKLGWQIEGVLRQRVLIADRFIDWTLVALLRDEFVLMPPYEGAGM